MLNIFERGDSEPIPQYMAAFVNHFNHFSLTKCDPIQNQNILFDIHQTNGIINLQ